MSRFEFQTPLINQALSELYQAHNEMSEAAGSLMGSVRALNAQHSPLADRSRSALYNVKRKIDSQYEWDRHMIQTLKSVKDSVRIAELKASGDQSLPASFAEAAAIVFDPGWTKGRGKAICPIRPDMEYSGELMSFDGKAEASANLNFIKDGKINKEFSAQAEAEGSFSMAEGKIISGLGLLSSEVEGSVGRISGQGKVKGVLFNKKGDFDPSLEAGVKASAEGASVKSNIKFGTDKLNIHSTQEATLGYAEAKAGVKVSRDGISGEAKAGAYAARGKVTAGFNLFEIKIDLEGEGKAGGASIGGEFGVDSHSATIGGEAGFIAGLSIKIKISW